MVPIFKREWLAGRCYEISLAPALQWKFNRTLLKPLELLKLKGLKSFLLGRNQPLTVLIPLSGL